MDEPIDRQAVQHRRGEVREERTRLGILLHSDHLSEVAILRSPACPLTSAHIPAARHTHERPRTHGPCDDSRTHLSGFQPAPVLEVLTHRPVSPLEVHTRERCSPTRVISLTETLCGRLVGAHELWTNFEAEPPHLVTPVTSSHLHEGTPNSRQHIVRAAAKMLHCTESVRRRARRMRVPGAGHRAGGRRHKAARPRDRAGRHTRTAPAAPAKGCGGGRCSEWNYSAMWEKRNQRSLSSCWATAITMSWLTGSSSSRPRTASSTVSDVASI